MSTPNCEKREPEFNMIINRLDKQVNTMNTLARNFENKIDRLTSLREEGKASISPKSPPEGDKTINVIDKIYILLDAIDSINQSLENSVVAMDKIV